ncbi:glycoside hydrolase family 71/99 protein [Bacillus massiliglaciei]|uniref:hypothetical protein n=1 Tax=Bacillus massiliglaciei TaxID=1816693 RepID=UPI000DA62068|nr:hypothetical protein [Bacillus massiliglaciei]
MRRLLLVTLILGGLTLLFLLKFEKTNDKKTPIKKIGVMQNNDEDIYSYPKRLEFGELKKAPIASPAHNKQGVDILAHWYNDFGLEYTASASNQSNGSYTWYDWSWNHTNNPNYDPSRHPLLGWYKGDDPNVLDWQSYWLVKYGVTGIILSGVINKNNFYQKNEKMYWVNMLMNKTKNFQRLKYSLWLDSNSPKSEANAQQDFIIDHILKKHPNIYTYEVDGKRYPVFFVWDMESFRGIYDNYNGSKISGVRFIYLAERMKKLGYDGICILGRNLVISPSSYNEKQVGNLKRKGVYLFRGSYSTLYGDNYDNSYSKYANTVAFPNEKYNVLNVMTSAESQYPHPSKWKVRGSTPELFETVLRRATHSIRENKQPEFLTIYNISEWAEGGPGLQPNKRDGFGYLKALNNVITEE